MKTYKQIAYAYPTSKVAEFFGMSKSGCYYVQLVSKKDFIIEELVGDEWVILKQEEKL